MCPRRDSIGPLRQTGAFPEQYGGLSGGLESLMGLKMALSHRKRLFQLHEEPLNLTDKGLLRQTKGLPGQHKAVSDRRKALLGRKSDFLGQTWPSQANSERS